LHLPVIDKETRKTEKELNRKYREAHPRFLGALLDAVSAGLKNLETTVVTNPPSMASFAHWVKACEPGLPWEAGTFLTVYHNMQLGASEDLFEKDQFAVALFNWLWPRIQNDEKTIEITGADLLSNLNKPIYVERGRVPQVDMKEWPTSKNINNYVNRVAPLLSRKGIRTEETKRTSKTNKRWRFELVTAQRKLEQTTATQ